MKKEKLNLSDMDTYVFIDVSNIRSAALKSCRIQLDFAKLIQYLKGKYKNLKSVKYFEGIADGDTDRLRQFKQYKRLGYEICTLSRKAYINPAKYKSFECKRCKHSRRIKVLPQSTTLKSNVDVYIASELLSIAFSANKPIHIILMACDGDYAEMIKAAVKVNNDLHVTVLATPTTRGRNALSIRLKQLRSQLPNNYLLRSISEIKDKIS